MISICSQSRRAKAATLVAVVVLLVGYGFVFAREPQRSDWYCCFVRAALRMQHGQPIHIVDKTPYAYPPLMAMLTIPLAQLPTGVGIVAWYVVSLVTLAIALWYAWRLIGGPTHGRLRGRWAAVAALGLLCSLRFIIGPLETRQFDTVIAALLMAGCWRLAGGHRSSGGVLLGLAAAMKCTPLLLVPYLAWRRWYGAAVLVTLTAVAANLLPEFCFPQQSGGWYAADWKRHFLDVSHRVPPGTWFSGLAQNQSLAGMFQRLFRYGLPLSTQAISGGEFPAESVPLLRACVYAASALLLASTLYFGRRGRVGCDFRGRNDDDPAAAMRHFAAEISAVFALMLLVSPMTSRAHYLILILPSLLICHAAIIDRDPFFRRLLPVLLVCGPLVTKGLVGKTLGDLALAWSLPTWYAIVCLAGMWRLLARRCAARMPSISPQAFLAPLAAANGRKRFCRSL
ncbi:MAG TPA: glycosyltransferase family 87 protein [Pirellulales bacterium]